MPQAKRTLLFLTALWIQLLLTPAASAGELPQQIWQTQVASGSAAGEAWGTQVVCDSAGAAYVTGYQTSSPYGTTLLLQKFDPAGRLQWRRSHPGYPGDLLPQSLLLTSRQQIVLAALATHPSSALLLYWYDTTGNLLHEVRHAIAGSSAVGSCLMTSDQHGQIYLALNCTNGALILLRYNAIGELTWQQRPEAAGDEMITAITVDSSGALFVAAKIHSTGKMVLYKFDASGAELWRSLYDEPGGHMPCELAAGREGGCCLLALSTPPESYAKDLLTLDFTADGALAWSARHETGVESYYTPRLARDLDGRLYVAGRQAVDGESTAAVFICYAGDGEKRWQTAYAREWLEIDDLHALTLDRAGGLYLAATSESWQEHRRMLICKVDPAGVLDWASFYPDDSDQSFAAEGAAMAVTGDGRCIIAGEQRDVSSSTMQLAVLGLDTAGRQSWQAHYAGEKTSRDHWRDCQTDASGRLYVLGTSMEGEINTAFLAVWGPDGTLQWRLPLTSPDGHNTSLSLLSVDRGGAAYISGTAMDKQEWDVFSIARVSAAGELQWWRTAAAADQYSCMTGAQALDQQGNLIITGSFHHSPGSGDPGGNVYTCKLDPGGRLLWEAVYAGSSHSDDHPMALAVDASGHACVATVGNDRQILRYDPDGRLLWKASYRRTSSSSDWPEQLAIDPEQNLWLWCYSEDRQTGVRRQGVLSKFSPRGERLWQTVEGGPQGFVRSTFLSVDARGQATAAGYYWEGPGVEHYFVTRIDAEGRAIWRTVAGKEPILSGLVDHAGCAWLLAQAGAGGREVLGFDGQGESIGAWPVAEVNASRMLGDGNGRFYILASQLGYGWSTFELGRYATPSAAAATIPRLAILQNFPNPFNISTTIRYSVQQAGRVQITIHDRLGREVAQPIDAPHRAGWHELVWNSSQPSGLYFICLESAAGRVQRKIVLLR